MSEQQVSQYRRENDQRFTSDEDLDACFEPDGPDDDDLEPVENEQ